MHLKLLLAALVAILFGSMSTAEAVAPEPFVYDSLVTDSSDASPISSGKADRLESVCVLERSASQTAVARGRFTTPARFFVAPNNVLPEFTQKQYVRPGGGSRPGTGTVGMVELDNGTGALLQSGRTGPASAIPRGTPGFNGITKTHVEGHAAALMRQTGVQDATLWINRVPCPGVNGCGARLPGMLPEGGRLRVLGPDGYDEVFTGVPD